MSEGEKRIIAGLRRRWEERHAVYRDTWNTGLSGEIVSFTYWSHRPGEDRCCYTTERMFDRKFWSMRYRYVKSRSRYELVRSSIRRHAKRKDAKARSLALFRGETV
jgi:hypothetical protein